LEIFSNGGIMDRKIYIVMAGCDYEGEYKINDNAYISLTSAREAVQHYIQKSGKIYEEVKPNFWESSKVNYIYIEEFNIVGL